MNYRTGNWTDDLFCLQYKEKKLVDISKEDLDLGEEDEDEKKKSAEIEEEYKPLTDWILETLGADKVEKVAVSKRLTDTPCILVTSKFGWSANMERIMKAQVRGVAQSRFHTRVTENIHTRIPNHRPINTNRSPLIPTRRPWAITERRST